MQIIKPEITGRARTIGDLATNFGGISIVQAKMLSDNDEDKLGRTLSFLRNEHIAKLSDDGMLVLPYKSPFAADAVVIDCLWIAINKAMYFDEDKNPKIDMDALSGCFRPSGKDVAVVTFLRDGVCYYVVPLAKNTAAGTISYLKTSLGAKAKEDFDGVMYVFAARDDILIFDRIWKDKEITFPYKTALLKGPVNSVPNVKYVHEPKSKKAE